MLKEQVPGVKEVKRKKVCAKTLVLGLGNPLRCDDGVGIRVARELQEKNIPVGVEILEEASSGLNLLEIISGYERLIVIDAIVTGKDSPGKIYRLGASDFSSHANQVLSHGIALPQVIALAQKLGLPLPREILIFAVEAEDVLSFSENCTPQVEAAIPRAVDLMLRELERG